MQTSFGRLGASSSSHSPFGSFTGGSSRPNSLVDLMGRRRRRQGAAQMLFGGQGPGRAAMQPGQQSPPQPSSTGEWYKDGDWWARRGQGLPEPPAGTVFYDRPNLSPLYSREGSPSPNDPRVVRRIVNGEPTGPWGHLMFDYSPQYKRILGIDEGPSRSSLEELFAGGTGGAASAGQSGGLFSVPPEPVGSAYGHDGQRALAHSLALTGRLYGHGPGPSNLQGLNQQTQQMMHPSLAAPYGRWTAPTTRPGFDSQTLHPLLAGPSLAQQQSDPYGSHTAAMVNSRPLPGPLPPEATQGPRVGMTEEQMLESIRSSAAAGEPLSESDLMFLYGRQTPYGGGESGPGTGNAGFYSYGPDTGYAGTPGQSPAQNRTDYLASGRAVEMGNHPSQARVGGLAGAQAIVAARPDIPTRDELIAQGGQNMRANELRLAGAAGRRPAYQQPGVVQSLPGGLRYIWDEQNNRPVLLPRTIDGIEPVVGSTVSQDTLEGVRREKAAERKHGQAQRIADKFGIDENLPDDEIFRQRRGQYRENQLEELARRRQNRQAFFGEMMAQRSGVLPPWAQQAQQAIDREQAYKNAGNQAEIDRINPPPPRGPSEGFWNALTAALMPENAENPLAREMYETLRSAYPDLFGGSAPAGNGQQTPGQQKRERMMNVNQNLPFPSPRSPQEGEANYDAARADILNRIHSGDLTVEGAMKEAQEFQENNNVTSKNFVDELKALLADREQNQLNSGWGGYMLSPEDHGAVNILPPDFNWRGLFGQ